MSCHSGFQPFSFSLKKIIKFTRLTTFFQLNNWGNCNMCDCVWGRRCRRFRLYWKRNSWTASRSISDGREVKTKSAEWSAPVSAARRTARVYARDEYGGGDGDRRRCGIDGRIDDGENCLSNGASRQLSLPPSVCQSGRPCVRSVPHPATINTAEHSFLSTRPQHGTHRRSHASIQRDGRIDELMNVHSDTMVGEAYTRRRSNPAGTNGG